MINLIDLQEIWRLTDVHMRDPQIGDRFHERYAYWVYVVDRQGDQLVIADGVVRPQDLPAGATFRTVSVQELQQEFAYKSVPGYSVDYCDTDPQAVQGWLENKG